MKKTSKKRFSLNEKKLQEITSLYRELTEDLSSLHHTLNDFLPGADVQKVFDFLRTDARLWLAAEYGHAHSDEYPKNVDVRQLVLDGYIRKPESFNLCKAGHDFVNDTLKKIRETGFFFPISKLFFPDLLEEGGAYILTEDFHAEVETFCGNFATTPKQIEIIEEVQKLVDVLNTIHQKEIINGRNAAGINGLTNQLSRLISIDRRMSGESPFQIDPFIFWKNSKFGKLEMMEPESHTRLFVV